MYYVQHTGHQFAMCAVAHKTQAEAVAHAQRACKDALRTQVIDCTKGPVGVVLLTLNSNGQQVRSY
jgi:hypothetical protein